MYGITLFIFLYTLPMTILNGIVIVIQRNLGHHVCLGKAILFSHNYKLYHLNGWLFELKFRTYVWLYMVLISPIRYLDVWCLLGGMIMYDDAQLEGTSWLADWINHTATWDFAALCFRSLDRRNWRHLRVRCQWPTSEARIEKHGRKSTRTPEILLRKI